MNLLDENVRDDQRVLLRQWRVPFRQIGRGLSHAGIQDADLIPLLHRLKRPTLFTQDQDFFKRALCDRAYCLAWLDVSDVEAAVGLHPAFPAPSDFQHSGPAVGHRGPRPSRRRAILAERAAEAGFHHLGMKRSGAWIGEYMGTNAAVVESRQGRQKLRAEIRFFRPFGTRHAFGLASQR